MGANDEKVGEANQASEASMMPTLPEPWEGLVADVVFHVYSAGTADEFGDKLADNHDAFEAERALRLALNDLLQQLNG